MKSIRNESAETLPKHKRPLLVGLYYNEEHLLTLTLDPTLTAANLLTQVKQALSERFDAIAGLRSLDQYYALDYALSRPNWPLTSLRSPARLAVVLEEPVGPTPRLSDLEFLQCVGEGVSAAVYLVRHRGSGRLYALKQIRKDYFKEFRAVEGVLRERKILSEIVGDLPFATKLEIAFQSSRHLNFLLQFYPGGELFYHLTTRKLSEEEARLCLAEVMLTLEALHQRGVIYRDLKPENVMVDLDGHLHLGDFGMSRIDLGPQDLAFSCCGSPEYMAPETKLSHGYGFPADFYTLGALLYEMVVGVPPYYQGAPLNFPPSISQDFVEIVTRLIHHDPTCRLASFPELRTLRWLRKVDWGRVARREYRMPLRLDAYQSYIHQQFKDKVVEQPSEDEERYDRLFQMFTYLNLRSQGLSGFYPQCVHKKPTPFRSSQKKSKSNSSNNSSKDKPFYRKNMNNNNLYTHREEHRTENSIRNPSHRSSNKDKSGSSSKYRLEAYKKSKQKQNSTERNLSRGKALGSLQQLMGKKKETGKFQRAKSPIKFRKVGQEIKASEYMRNMGKQISKSKR